MFCKIHCASELNSWPFLIISINYFAYNIPVQTVLYAGETTLMYSNNNINILTVSETQSFLTKRNGFPGIF